MHPKSIDTFVNNSTRVFLQRKLKNFIDNPFSNSSTFILPEEFIAKLNDIVPIGGADELINFEVDVMNDSFSGFMGHTLLTIAFRL